MPTIINPTLPNILINGTTADATQVMADFASIISQVNANAAENGANSSITSLSGLTTAITVAQGGTSLTTLTLNALLAGNGTSAPQLIVSGTAGTYLRINATGALPAWSGLQSSDVLSGLGFTPVQQGTGVGQTTNVIKIGYSAANQPKLTVDTSDFGYIVMAASFASSIFNQPSTLGFNSGSAGLFDNGNRVWSPGNYNPLTANGIGIDIWYATTIFTEGQTTSLSGRPGTWICLSSTIFNSNVQAFRRIA